NAVMFPSSNGANQSSVDAGLLRSGLEPHQPTLFSVKEEACANVLQLIQDASVGDFPSALRLSELAANFSCAPAQGEGQFGQATAIVDHFPAGQQRDAVGNRHGQIPPCQAEDAVR